MSKEETLRERKNNTERKSAKMFNRLDALATALLSDKAKLAEQEYYVLAIAIVAPELPEAFTKEILNDTINDSEAAAKLGIRSYLYKERKTDDVIAMLQDENTHAVCADRILQRETVHLTHPDGLRAKTSNTYHTLTKSSIADSVPSKDDITRHRDSMPIIREDVRGRLEAIASLAVSIASK